MTLKEVVYQIDGRLQLNSLTFELVLLDKIDEPARVRPSYERKETEARAKGSTPSEAYENLVKLLRGNILLYEWPVMWTSTTSSLRIPETLTAD